MLCGVPRFARCLSCLAAVAIALGVAQSAAANPSQCAPYGPPNPSPRIVHTSLDGLELNVLLPTDYGASGKRRYPVLYLLHGADYNENTWLRETDAAKFTAPLTGHRGVIVVMPDGGPFGFYRDWFDGSQQWERYHLRRLIPFIESRFRTRARRAYRAVAGFSMGGVGAANYAARHPDLFAVVGSFSGIVHSTTPEPAYRGAPARHVRTDSGSPGPRYGGRRAPAYRRPDDNGSGCQSGGQNYNGNRVDDAWDWHNHNPTDLASNLRSVAVFNGAGNGTPCPDDATATPSGLFLAEPAIRSMAEAFDAALTDARVKHTTVYQPCGVHNLRSSQRQLHAFWPLMAHVFASPPRRPARFDYRTADPDFSVWGWRFHADPRRAPEFLEVRGATRRGFTLTGSGTETVLTGRSFKPRQRVTVEGARPANARAGRRGRVRVAVDLGKPNRVEQFSGSESQRVLSSRRVTFKPRAGRRARAAVLPRHRRCARPARFVIRFRVHARLRKVVVRVNGRRVFARTRPRIPGRVTLRRLPRHRILVRVDARTRAGRRLRSARRYRSCRRSPSRSSR
jgi:S-formylglutathione hydrolase FrmB